MLGKTHRITGMAVYTGLLVQSTSQVHTFNESMFLTRVLDEAFTTPVLKFLRLTQLRDPTPTGAALAQYLLMTVLYGIVIYYALVLPDIDSKNSTLGRYVPFIEDTIGHRTLFHSIVPLLGLIAASIFTSGLIQVLLTLTTSAYAFHLIEDAYSLQGINWFIFPIKTKWSKYRYRVDGGFEHIVFYIATIITFVNIASIAYISGIAGKLPELLNF